MPPSSEPPHLSAAKQEQVNAAIREARFVLMKLQESRIEPERGLERLTGYLQEIADITGNESLDYAVLDASGEASSAAMELAVSKAYKHTCIVLATHLYHEAINGDDPLNALEEIETLLKMANADASVLAPAEAKLTADDVHKILGELRKAYVSGTKPMVLFGTEEFSELNPNIVLFLQQYNAHFADDGEKRYVTIVNDANTSYLDVYHALLKSGASATLYKQGHNICIEAPTLVELYTAYLHKEGKLQAAKTVSVPNVTVATGTITHHPLQPSPDTGVTL